MIDINFDNTEYASCANCQSTRDGYRKIYSIEIGERSVIKFNLCTECMSMLIEKTGKSMRMEFPQNKETEHDSEVEIDNKLRMLLNKKIFEIWNEDCQKEFYSLDFDKMSPSQKMIYMHIYTWDDNVKDIKNRKSE